MPVSAILGRAFGRSGHFIVEEAVRMDSFGRIPLMHTPARHGVRLPLLNQRRATNGFTLIELLTVISIIAILSGIAFGLMSGVNEKKARSQAQTEIAVLAQALEAYKAQYGDYPQINGSASSTQRSQRMLQALIGRQGPGNPPATMQGRALIEVSRFALAESSDPEGRPVVGADPFTTNTLQLVDPWGKPYQYYYYTVNTPITRRGFILFSSGPDGNPGQDPTTSGVNGGKINEDNDTTDNIYASK